MGSAWQQPPQSTACLAPSLSAATSSQQPRPGTSGWRRTSSAAKSGRGAAGTKTEQGGGQIKGRKGAVLVAAVLPVCALSGPRGLAPDAWAFAGAREQIFPHLEEAQNSPVRGSTKRRAKWDWAVPVGMQRPSTGLGLSDGLLNYFPCRWATPGLKAAPAGRGPSLILPSCCLSTFSP